MYVTDILRNISHIREQIVPGPLGTKRMRVEVRACVVLLIDGLGHSMDSWSPTRSLAEGR